MLGRRRVVLLILGVALLILVALLFHLFRSREEENELTLYGNVDVRQVDIGFRVSGQVTQLLYEEGDFVPSGSLLALLDPTPYVSQLDQARASADALKANLLNTELQLKRRQELIQSGAVSCEDLDNIHANYEALVANLKAADAATQVASDQLSYTKVFAPSDGIILTRIREPGTVVNPADPVYTLSLTSPLWVRAYVDEPHLALVEYGMEATVFTDTRGGSSYTGKIGFISPIAEFTPKTVETTELRTDLVYRLRIYIDHPDCMLKQGMPVTVKIPIKTCPSHVPH